MTNATKTILNVLRAHNGDVEPVELRELLRDHTVYRELHELAEAMGDRGYTPTVRGTHSAHNSPMGAKDERDAAFARDRLRLGLIERGLVVYPDPSGIEEDIAVPSSVRIVYDIAA